MFVDSNILPAPGIFFNLNFYHRILALDNFYSTYYIMLVPTLFLLQRYTRSVGDPKDDDLKWVVVNLNSKMK